MSGREGGRRIKVEVRGLPKARHMLMFISERMNKVRDFGIKLKYVCEDINQSDEIKIYRDKFLLPDNENINIIRSGEEIIVYVKATEYVESKESKAALIHVREEVLKENEKKLKIKEMELQSREDTLRKKEEHLNKREKQFNLKLDDFNVKTKELKEDLNVNTEELNLKREAINVKVEQTAENLMSCDRKRKAANPDTQSKKQKNNIGPVKTSSVVQYLQRRRPLPKRPEFLYTKKYREHN